MTFPVLAEHVTVDDVLSELGHWVNIETPSADAAAVNRLADRVEAFAREAGFDVDRTEGTLGFGDILTVRSTPRGTDNADRLLILAHIDTVHAVGTLAKDLRFCRDGDRLYGPGIYDMKAGVLMALTAMKLAAATGPHLPVDLLILPDEEVGSPSSRPVIEAHAKRAAWSLVVEPARDGGKIVTARKGVALCDIRVQGRAAHAGVRPEAGRSAIRAAARLVLELDSLNDPARGMSECVLQVDLRLPDQYASDEVMARIAAMTPVDPDIKLDISVRLNRPPFAQSPRGQQLFDHAASIASALGFVLEGVTTGGGSDGNLTAALGVPTLDGLGADGGGAHTFDEHILVSSIAPRCALLANLIATLGSRDR